MQDKLNSIKQSTHQKVIDFIKANNIPYQQISHEPAHTCEQSAEARNESIAIGGKTLLFKSKKAFHLFVLSAAKEVDSTRVRKIVKSQKLRFATKEELLEMAGVVKGALPPFGEPVLPFEIYIDLSILQNERIAFNAGLLTESIILACSDYLEIIEANNGKIKYANFSKN